MGPEGEQQKAELLEQFLLALGKLCAVLRGSLEKANKAVLAGWFWPMD